LVEVEAITAGVRHRLSRTNVTHGGSGRRRCVHRLHATGSDGRGDGASERRRGEAHDGHGCPAHQYFLGVAFEA
jgi:hypothetical protein